MKHQVDAKAYSGSGSDEGEERTGGAMAKHSVDTHIKQHGYCRKRQDEYKSSSDHGTGDYVFRYTRLHNACNIKRGNCCRILHMR